MHVGFCCMMQAGSSEAWRHYWIQTCKSMLALLHWGTPREGRAWTTLVAVQCFQSPDGHSEGVFTRRREVNNNAVPSSHRW
jgi:hypothetical protein